MTAERPAATSLRLWLTKKLMPNGYALWEYGRYSDDGLDAMVFEKELSDAELDRFLDGRAEQR